MAQADFLRNFWSRYQNIPLYQRYGAAGFLIVLVVCADLFLMYLPQESNCKDIQEEIYRIHHLQQEKKIIANSLPEYEERYNQMLQALQTARLLLPDEADVPHFLANLGNSARDIGLQLTRFEPREEQIKDFYVEIIFDLEMHGNYHEIGSFLDQISKMERIVNVVNLKINNPKVENNRVLVDGYCQVKIYRFLSEEQLKAMASNQKASKK